MIPSFTVDLETLLPHRGGMLLLSEIVSFDPQGATTRAVVREGWPLTGPDGADPLVLIELVAQTAAVNNVWELIQTQGPEGDHRGWIVGIRSARLGVDRIALGTELEIRSRNQFAYEEFRDIEGTVSVAGEAIAEVALQLVQAAP
jgi:predicted hotdog family 3-hydroxylacyl-ACP dehydratase